jgi:molybdate transport system substrate-binding protein
MFLPLVACGGSSTEDSDSIVVFAASSLTTAFADIAEGFTERTGVDVEFNFLSSAELATQIEQGASADVFASADEANMQRVVDGELVKPSEVFARNALELVVAEGNPEGIDSLDDLENDDLVLSMCTEGCPAGRYARELFDKNDLDVSPDSQELDVRAVLTRVATGEADVGIVYRTDVIASDDVDGVPIDEKDNVIASYPIAVVDGAPDTADDFVAFVLEAGQDVLEDHGFVTA